MAKAEVHIAAEGAVPIGCVVSAIDANVEVHLLVKGKLNVEEELAKLRKNHTLITKSIATLQKTMANTSDKIPEAVKQQNEAKFKELQAESAVIEASIKNFESIEN